jgi:regulator of nucleoside diphosphate kinase
MTKQERIYTTENDLELLSQLIENMRMHQNGEMSYVNTLEEKLEFAESVAPEKIAADVITMGSQVKVLDLDTNKGQVWSIVFPDEANYDEGKISILAPLATALLGHKKGDTVLVKAPTRTRRLKVEAVLFQPESAAVV